MLLELDGRNANAVLRKYTWGLDLAGHNGSVNSLESAGSIGGLLAVYDTNGTPGTSAYDLSYVYLYDGNGNVGRVVDPNAANATVAIKAKYEYDPYGARTNTPGAGEFDQLCRFSTKQFDAETGLGYWGYRYYSPGMGRWIGRDPMGEAGGVNLTRYAANTPACALDPVGLEDRDGCCGPEIGWRLSQLIQQFEATFNHLTPQRNSWPRHCAWRM